MQLAFRINALALLTYLFSLIETVGEFRKSPNRLQAENGKAAATGIANGFGISTHNIYSVSDSALQGGAA